jgi:hypothetical protein
MGSLRLWLGFDTHGITGATGDLTLRDARVQLAADTLPLELSSLSGRAIYEPVRRASRSPPMGCASACPREWKRSRGASRSRAWAAARRRTQR